MAGALSGRAVTIVGGGIGGLTAALCCTSRGADVTLNEQAPAFTEVGAGLQASPNGARVLEALGLGPALDAAGVRAEAVEPMDALTGRQLARIDLTRRAGPPYRFLHRAALIDVLAGAARAAGVDLRTGSRIEGAASGDIVIAADGLHSAHRAGLNPGTEPFFTGQVAWRAVIPDTEAAPVARVWMAPGRHLVTYPLGQGRLNIVAVQERRAWSAEGWHHAADPATLRSAFTGLSGRVSGFLARVTEVAEWGLFRHPVAKVWHDGARLALLGDAAHPTLPFLAQGANMAIEDAWALTACLDAAPPAEALPRYQAARRDRVVRAIAAANANAVTYHLSGLRRTASHLALRGVSATLPSLLTRRLDWLYDHDVTRT